MSKKSIFVSLFILFFQSGLIASQRNSVIVRNQLSTNNIFLEKDIVCLMQKVFQWQINNPVILNDHQEQWARSAFYSGIMYAYKITGKEFYLDQTIKWADGWQWKRGSRYRFADDIACGHAYLDAYAVKKDPKMLVGIRSTIDSLIADPKSGREDWWWCDALFMAPPVLVRLGNITNERKYYTYLDHMYWDATDYLYSPSDSLFFRDKNFFYIKTKNGKKIFWSRGNAWVIGGLTQMLGMMSKDNPSRPKYLSLYKRMIYKIASLQQPDGLWRASLLDPLQVPVKETSGSTFFTFAMAWGVNNGILPEKEFLPKIKKAWTSIVQCINKDGRLGYVQPVGEMPENVKESDYQEYGSGAFLMAGSEMIKMAKRNQVKNDAFKRKMYTKTIYKNKQNSYNITSLTIK